MAYAYTAGDPLQQVDPMGLSAADSSGGQGVLSGIFNGLKSLGSGIAYGVNPAHWDEVYRSTVCAAEANGGGFGGWYTAANVQLNPMFAVIESGATAVSAARDGRWGDAAESGVVAAGIFALTVAPVKLPRVVAVTARVVAKVVERVRISETAITIAARVKSDTGAIEFGAKPGAAKSGMAGVRATGAAGEAAAGIVKNTTRIPSASGKAAYRIPDELGSSVLGEVKNVKSLGWSSQISDMYSYAAARGREFTLYVRPSTVFRGQLAELFKYGGFTRVDVPGMWP